MAQRRTRAIGDADSSVPPDGLMVQSFATRQELRSWLEREHSRSSGVWVRVAKAGSGIPSVTFHDLLEEGLCFGWSESTRRAGDDTSYLQRFTPRRTRGTTSERNRRLVVELRTRGLMTPAGEAAL
ncbi:conserved hypothetical protein [Nostocoides australiense Ben110]|uniref:Uncharacterized protein n=1 Tax=Nostocoides australiense Ben110 TaxID=1193182 RepID=W6JTI2_9MICO|nr:hypothetical protein [Tetrasphaera australiensis]CCH72618.1 conserved hypothetical protein [Tetrasphaera australiensis Ben110]HRW00486.1 hypothetical protein [Tetrasphaera sp.]